MTPTQALANALQSSVEMVQRLAVPDGQLTREALAYAVSVLYGAVNVDALVESGEVTSRDRYSDGLRLIVFGVQACLRETVTQAEPKQHPVGSGVGGLA